MIFRIYKISLAILTTKAACHFLTPAFVAYIPLYGEFPAIICTDHENIFMAIYCRMT